MNGSDAASNTSRERRACTLRTLLLPVLDEETADESDENAEQEFDPA